MPTARPKTATVALTASLFACLSAAVFLLPSTAAAQGGDSAIWGFEFRPGAPELRTQRLQRVRAAGGNTLLLDARRLSARQRSRIHGAAVKGGLARVVVRAAGRRRGACAGTAAGCAVGPRSRGAARRLARRTGPSVVVRLGSPHPMRRLTRWRARRNVVALVRLPSSRRLNRRVWRRAIVRARDSRDVDLAVSVPRRHGKRALNTYLRLLRRTLGKAPDRPVQPPPAPPRATRPADRFISTTGDDANPCTAGRPCRSFDRGFRAAEPGHVVEVAGGTYPDQRVRADTAKRGDADVVFRAAPGARVVVNSDLDVEAAHVEFRDLVLTENWYAHPGSHHLIFRGIRAQRFQITSASDVQVIGGDYGPSIDAVSQIKAASASDSPPRRIRLEGVHVHDYTRTSDAQHMECVHVMAADGLTIRRSRFNRCSIFAISFNAHAEHMRGIVVENSWFGEVLDGGSYAVHFSSGVPCEATIRFNSFADQGMSQECPETGAGVTVSSNVFQKSPSGGAANGYAWDHNVYVRGERVGPHDVVASAGFVDAPTFDLHLRAGAAAIDRGDPRQAPADDIDGGARRGPPDVGGDELG